MRGGMNNDCAENNIDPYEWRRSGVSCRSKLRLAILVPRRPQAGAWSYRNKETSEVDYRSISTTSAATDLWMIISKGVTSVKLVSIE